MELRVRTNFVCRFSEIKTEIIHKHFSLQTGVFIFGAFDLVKLKIQSLTTNTFL